MSCTILSCSVRGRSAPSPLCLSRVITAIFFFVISVSAVFSQTPVLTQHYDNSRTGQNITETILTPSNVNSAQFGMLFQQTLDGQMPAQPLYVPNVFIPAANSSHNVVYVATMHDSVYAFDADSNQGSNASPLWYTNFLNPAAGITSVPEEDEFCHSAYTEFGIQGTPVIDTTRNAIYVVAMTKENGAYVHKIHALDLGTGAELFGGPAVITGSVTIDNQLYTFIDKYQQERPALLLQDGIVYIGWGGPGCNVKSENGWVMAYDGGTLEQVGVFDASPDVKASAVWLSGAGLVGDGNHNIYANTGDGLFDVNTGGSHYGDSVLKFNQGDGVINLVDSFTPSDQKYLALHDLDVSSGALVLLPGSTDLLGVDKNGTIYLMNESQLGGYSDLADNIVQEIVPPAAQEVHGGLTYWNDNVYVAAYNLPVAAYSFNSGSSGLLSLAPTSQTPRVTAHPQGGIVSSNGTNDAIFWYVSVPTSILFAFDATNLATEFYDSTMAGARDKFGPTVHYEMPVVADGRVYINGETKLSVFGLLPDLAATAGNNQAGVVKTKLPITLQAQLQSPYSGAIKTSGIPVTFKVTGGAGTLSNPEATTNSSGIASTSYTLPPKPGVYTITASTPGYASATFTETATLGAPASLAISSGNQQKEAVASLLDEPLQVRVKDSAGNGVPGIAVSFSDGGAGGTVSSPTATTDSSGYASTTYKTGTEAGSVSITASVTGLKSVIFKETVLSGSATTLSIYSGNNQSVKAGATAPKELEVLVVDKYSNPVGAVSVTYSAGTFGGSFSLDPAETNPKGIAGTRYTTPTKTGTVTVTASAAGLSSVQFTITVH